jgi:uncharacterized protein (TIGR00255 family)
MIRSMTAFARQTGQYSWGTAVWELRSVNHRYLEPSFKMPEAGRALEPMLREKLRKQLNRGKLDVGLRMQQQGNGGNAELTVNQSLLAQLISASEAVAGELQNPAAINPLELLQWPGVLSEQAVDAEAIEEQLLALFQQALEQLIHSREREGAELKAMIEQRLSAISDITTAVRKQMPQILAAQQQKLRDRLLELGSEINPERLEQELVIIAQKADVDEELDRLQTHVNEVQRVLNTGGACGRRLDFLMQELNREANTLSSKSIVSDSTQAAVELKVLIEQMREQVQNIE